MAKTAVGGDNDVAEDDEALPDVRGALRLMGRLRGVFGLATALRVAPRTTAGEASYVGDEDGWRRGERRCRRRLAAG